MASTSSFEIGLAAAPETVDVPANGGEALAAVAVDGEEAEVPFAEPADGAGPTEPAAAVTLAACLEPKMADTMLPKTLIFSSSYLLPWTSRDFRHPIFHAGEGHYASKRAVRGL